MKNNLFNSEISKGLNTQFKSLNNDEMNNLRGGVATSPDLPPSGGEDFPIDPYKK